MNNASTYHFVVESMEIENGRQVKNVKPDERGYYDLPVAIIGVPNRSNIYYDPSSFIQCITDESSNFNILIREKNLYGEYGHPLSDDINRNLLIDESKISHHIKRVYTGETLPNGGTILMAKIKPHGPYKEKLEENIRDPDMNTAFSLRAISEQKIDQLSRRVIRYMKYLMTFDYVYGSGFKEATKRYAISNENFAIEIKKEDFFNTDGVLCVEHITDRDILNIFGAKEITIRRSSKLIRFENNSTIFNTDGNKSSILFEALKQ